MVIRKGTHKPFRLPKLLVDCNSLSYSVRFTETCKYTLPPEDQLDTNKLFGIGYFPSHHVNSVRFGWRYNPENPEKMEIMAYWYDDRDRFMTSMGFVDIGKGYKYEMWLDRQADQTIHYMKVSNGFSPNLYAQVTLNGKCDVGYLLGVYFGGNQKAPHDMVIVMEKLK